MHTRFFCTVLLLLAAELLLANDPVNDLYTISKINSIQKGWRAGYNNRFVNLTLTDASKLLGLAEEPVPESPIMRNEEKFVSATNLPDSFDSRARWPNCVMPIRNQEACGGCWSFAASSMFGMKQCIQSSGTLKVEIGPQYPISCDSFNGGCNGGTLSGAWRLYVSNGAISESDYPFDSQNGWTTMCVAKPNVPRYYAGSFTYLRTVSEMQQAIYTGGAIQVGFDVYQDFYNYNSGIYRHVSGAKVGGHSVYLVGWGSENGVDYWLGINSWSEEWGQRGEFKMLRGNNECNVELGYVPIAASIAVNPAYTTTPAPIGTTTRAPTSTTTRAPTTSTTTVKPTYNCWTCPAGQIHWSNVPGTPEPIDKCTCVPNPLVPTTCWTCPSGQAHWYEIPGRTAPVNGDQCACERNPAVPTNCWTCPSNYVHWFEVPGIKTPADRCACVPKPTTTAPTSTTRSPNTIQPITSTTTTTRAPTTTTTTARPTFGCWTCAPGYLHWYEIPGMAQPADRCACVVDPNVRNCWTCPSGFVHWFTIPGMAEPADRCACILKAKRSLNVVHNRLINKIY